MTAKRKKEAPINSTGKKKFLYFGGLLLALIVIIVIVVSGIKNQHTAPSDPAADPTSSNSGVATLPGEIIIPTIPEPSTPMNQPSEIPNSVTINRVEIPSGTKIDREPLYEPYRRPEGSVYKNDRTISIQLYNHGNKELETISFGLAKGSYDEYLYLNPIRLGADGKPKLTYFKYHKPVDIGFVTPITSAYLSEVPKDGYNSFTIRRTLEQRTPAEYVNPAHRGLVWLANSILDEPTSIEMILYDKDGGIDHILMLTISKDGNGCYFLSNIQNRNLQEVNDESRFSSEEIQYICDMAAADIYDADKISMAIINQIDLEPEDFIVDFRDSANREGVYYLWFLPKDPDISNYYADHNQLSTMAVTIRNHKGLELTLYYHIVSFPHDGKHGNYQYLGRDYTNNLTLDGLHQQGYPGYD